MGLARCFADLHFETRAKNSYITGGLLQALKA